MKLKFVNTPLATTWCVHDPESDTHLGNLVYEGSKQWHFDSQDEEDVIKFEAADYEHAVVELEGRIQSTVVIVPADTPHDKLGELLKRKVLKAVATKSTSEPTEEKTDEKIAGLKKSDVIELLENQLVSHVEIVNAASLQAEYMGRLIDLLADFVSKIELEEGRTALVEALQKSLQSAVTVRVAQRSKRESFLQELLSRALVDLAKKGDS